MIEGRGWKVKVCLHRAHLLSPVGSGICKTYYYYIVTSDIRVQYVQCSANRLAPYLDEFFPSTVGQSLEFVAVKKFGKELGENHNSNAPLFPSDKSFSFFFIKRDNMFTIIMHLKEYRLPCPFKRKQAFISLSNLT